MIRRSLDQKENPLLKEKRCEVKIDSSYCYYCLYISLVYVFSFYLWTQYPSIPGGDAGELLSEACHLGVPHPPGYPLFTILSHITIRLTSLIQNILVQHYSESNANLHHTINKLVSPARAVNTLSSILGVFTCFNISRSVSVYLYRNHYYNDDDKITTRSNDEERRTKENPNKYVSYHGAIAGIIFSLSPRTWEYSVGAEVFALNNFLISWIIFEWVQFDRLLEEYSFKSSELQRFQTLYKISRIFSLKNDVVVSSMKGAILCGLALSNQHTSLLFIIPISIYALMRLFYSIQWESYKRMAVVLSKLGFCFILGLSPYLFLIYASQEPKPGSWGDLTSWDGFWKHILRKEYGTLSLSAGYDHIDTEGSILRWLAHISDIRKQFTTLGLITSLIGIALTCMKEDKKGNDKKNVSRVGIALILTLLTYLVIWNGVFSNLPLSNPMAYEVQSRFWLQPNIIICFFSGIGTFQITQLPIFRHESSKLSLSKFMWMLVGAVCTKNTLSLIQSTSTPSSRWIMNNYGHAILDSLPAKSLLLSYSDLNWNIVRYLQICEEERSDVTHLSLQLIPYSWFQRHVQMKLYDQNGQVTYPTIHADISTNRFHDGHKRQLANFLDANLKSGVFQGGVYVEMQAILETDIETTGIWRYDKYEFHLLPWGPVYRVIPSTLKNHSTIRNDDGLRNKWYPKALQRLQNVRNNMIQHEKTTLKEGSWEFAAMTVYWDMHYQYALNVLSVSLQLGKRIKEEHSVIVDYVKLLLLSSKLLWQVEENMLLKNQKMISSNLNDIAKNSALSHMRLYEVMLLVPKLKDYNIEGLSEYYDTISFEDHERIQKRTMESVSSFLKTSCGMMKEWNGTITSSSDVLRSDKDCVIFEKFYNKLVEES